ncbi:MAG: protein translocase subunit SecD [Patescibacteria group bacterium]|jgi:protein-export membrane protein SecD|nr:protein translocase subunit SecD [Patescibacteria group bacterium]
MIGQRNKNRLTFLGIVIITVLAIFLDFSGQIKKTGLPLPDFFDLPFHLGLDLQGGTHLIYEADLSQIPNSEANSAVEGVRDVIERRVNSFGVAEPLVQTTKAGDSWRIIVELAGVTDVNQAIGMIGETPLLEFKELNPNPTVDIAPEQQQELNNYNTQALTKAQNILNEVVKNPDQFAEIAKNQSEDAGSATEGGDLGFVSRGMFVPEFEKGCFDDLTVGQIAPQLVETDFGYHIIKKEAEQEDESGNFQTRCRHILILKRTPDYYRSPNDEWLYTGLTGTQLKKAQVEFDPNTQAPQVALEFNNEGKDLFGEITKNNIGRPVAIFLDGTAISTPTVQSAITDGRAVISGNFTISEAKLLAQRLNAGALPVPINLISQQTIGASLGNESVTKSLRAGIIGLILISIFMILYYRLPGLLAVSSLLIYGLIILAVFKMIPVTLTLAGIAGFILSIGMAVDANILIFERFKEEIKNGKPLTIALNEGFKRAWPSIFDGNISTLITCFILMGFTTSLVKGFAVTLSIGILISMFSAMIVTKSLLNIILGIKFLNRPWLFGTKKKQ